MQNVNTESYLSVGRRSLDIEDYVDILRRHKGWILGPAFAALVVSVVVAFLWPDTYVSAATIRVVPPQVPAELVPSNVNSAMSQRINAMYQTISSRGALTNLINMYNLYPRDRNRKPMEDIVETFRKNIRISDVGLAQRSSSGRTQDIPAFQISFSYENRVLAQKVTQELVSRFISENTRERTTQSVLTTQFLKDQVEGARKQLESLDNKLASFRQSFSGRLPEQLTQNTMQLNMLEQRIGNLNASLGRIGQEKMLLESDLRTLKTQKSTLAPAPEATVTKQRNQQLDQLDSDILKLEAALAGLRERFTDKHPDVQRVASQLAVSRKMRDKLAAREEDEQETTTPVNASRRSDPLFEREARQIDANIERIDAMLKAKTAEAEGYQKDIAATERQIRAVQSRIEAAPASEQQYAELLRDQSLAKAKYDDLMRKQSQSAVAEELERRQQGEMLELLDSASLPETPTEPKRIMIIGAGTVMGFVFGALFAGAREARDTSLKNLKDVRAYTQLPILGSVPLLENDLVVRRRKRLAWLAWSTACLVGILIMTGAVFYYYATRV